MKNNLQIYTASITDRGLSEKRPQNEDSYLELKNLGLFAVADGVGGAQAGEVASQMAMEILSEAFANRQPNSDAEDVMRLAIERANAAIFQMSNDLSSLSMMATTIVALHLSGNIATIGHVGDSRLYRLDSKGNLYRETQDHSVVEEEVRAGRMTPAQAANHPSRNVISRALGAESTVEVDMKTIMFEPNTTFLLCSDGITRHISDFEIRELLLSNSSPAEICQRMKVICYERGAEDNLTAVIVRAVAVGNRDSVTPQTSQFPENEEATVASARPAFSTMSAVNEPNYDEEIPTTRNLPPTPALQSPDDFDENYLISEQPAETAYSKEGFLTEEPKAAIPQTSADSGTMSFSSRDSQASASPIKIITDKAETNLQTETKRGPGLFRKLLTGLFLLILGGILGAASLYVWQNYLVARPETLVLAPQSDNIVQTSHEKLKVKAINQPSVIIRQYEQSPPKDASDFYLLATAHLSLKQYEDAKKAFIEAKNRLKDVSDIETREALATEITQGLIIAQDEKVRDIYDKELRFTSGNNANYSGSLNQADDKARDTPANVRENKNANNF